MSHCPVRALSSIRCSRAAGRRRGFSLIEIMIGVAIGLIGMLVIFQTYMVFVGRSRTTTSGSDAQVVGTLAMFSMERDLRLAGMGFGRAQATAIGCPVTVNFNSLPAFNFPMVPVRIVPHPSLTGGPVSINVLYGNSSFYSSEQTFTMSSGTTKTALNRTGFQIGDMMIVAALTAGSAGPCALVEITDNTSPDGLTLSHASANYIPFYGGLSRNSRFNPSSGAGTFTTGALYNMGPDPRLDQWFIDGKTLRVTDRINGTTLDVGEGIVNLQAQYGLSNNNNGTIDEWTTTDPTGSNWVRVRAIRLAVLARSEQFEPDLVSPNPSWTDGNNNVVNFTMANLDGSSGNTAGSPNNWRNYRYRVYEKTIPLRNMIWGTMP